MHDGISDLVLRANGHSAGTDENLHVVERFTRTDADTMLYQFTVTDPTIWTRPWSGELPMTRSDRPHLRVRVP